MDRKRSKLGDTPSKAVTSERAARLYKLLQIVGTRPETRGALSRRLKLDVRGFYRDLELLRDAGLILGLENGRYALQERLKDATERLPFPDPRLTLGEALQLAKGRSSVHRKLQKQIREIVQAKEPVKRSRKRKSR